MSDEYEANLRNAVDFSYSKQPLKVSELVNDILSQKAIDAIENRRDEVAASIFDSGEEEGDEDFEEFDLDDEDDFDLDIDDEYPEGIETDEDA